MRLFKDCEKERTEDQSRSLDVSCHIARTMCVKLTEAERAEKRRRQRRAVCGRRHHLALSLCSWSHVSSAGKRLLDAGVLPFHWMSYCYAFHLALWLAL